MALGKSSVPVPVGGGIDRQAEETLLAPPKSRDVQAFRVRTDGAYQRVAGWDELGGVSAVQIGSGPVIAPVGAESVVALGSKGQALWRGNDIAANLSTGAVPTPSKLVHHHVARLNGRLGFPNVAQSPDGYTCVVVNEVLDTDPTQGAGVQGYVTRTVTHAFVLDDAWRVVAHNTWGASTYFREPRVEAYYDSVGVHTGFVVFGRTSDTTLKADSMWLESSWVAKGQQTIATSLYTFLAEAVYDTHADGDANIFVSYVLNVAGTGGLRLLRTTWNASTGVPTITTFNNGALSVTAEVKVNAVFYDKTANWVLQYCSDANVNTTLFYQHKDGTGNGTAVLPNVPGSDAWDSTWPRIAVCFWRDVNGDIHLPKNRIILSSPPTTASHTTYFATMHRRPQPSTVTGGWATFSTRDESRYGLRATQLYLASLGNAAVRRPLNSTTETHLVGLATSLRARTYDGGGGDIYRCGQTVRMSADRFLVPLTLPEPNIHPEAIISVDATRPVAAGSFDTPPATIFGQDNGAETLVIADCQLALGSRSYARVGDTTLIASGVLCACDGDTTTPAWLDMPAVTIPLQPSDLNNNASGTPSLRGVERWGRIFLSAAPTGAEERFLGFVLVYTDRNGTQARSKPFYVQTGAIDTLAVWTRNGATDGSTYYPAVWGRVRLPEHLQPMVAAGTLRMEVYMSDTYQDGVDPIPDPETFALACTSLVNTGGYFVIRDDCSPFVSTQDGPAEDTRPATTPLYAGTDLPAERPPATNVIALAGVYAFLVPSEAPQTYWVSKPLQKGRLPEWSAELSFPAPGGAGDVVSVAGTGDRAFLLCSQGTWELFIGSGPDATGAGSFGAPRNLYALDGCVGHNTTVAGTWGVFYVSVSGPKFITPDGNLNDIGRRVVDQMDVTTLTAAVYDETYREIWLFDATQAWVYSLQNDAWTRQPFGATQAADYVHRTVRWLGTDNVLRVPDDSSTDDGIDGPYTGTIVSPWLSFGDVEGFKRVWRVNLLLRRTAGTLGSLRVKLAYDYVDTTVDTSTWLWSDILALTNPHMLSVRPSRQKCAAVRVTIEEVTQDVGSLGNPDLRYDVLWTLAGLELEVGAKPGIVKLAAGAKK